MHIAIIPDGNRRWAKSKGLPSFEGHRQSGDRILPALIKKAGELGIQYFTFWALSTENRTKRSEEEIRNLYKFGRYFLNVKLDEMNKRGAQIRVIGDTHKLPDDLQKGIAHAVEKTKHNHKIVVIFAINYGGRDEIMRAINKIKKTDAQLQNIHKDTFGEYLDTAGIPDPDLIIRTGGEKRLSGFMLWQCNYAEIEFLDIMFPDFTPDILERCISDFSRRQRRFGR